MATPAIDEWFKFGRSDRKSGAPRDTIKKLLRSDDERFSYYQQGWDFQDAIQKEIESLPKPKDPPSTKTEESKA